MNQYTKCLFGGALVAAGLAAPSQATISFVGSRGALAGTDYIDWGQFGPTFSYPANPSYGTTNLGVGMKVSDPSAYSFGRRDQGNGWGGNFSYGDRLMWTLGASDTIRVDFAIPTDRVGANIQNDYFGGFTGQIEVFDTGGSSLGSFQAYGNSNGYGDGSALFLGIQSTGFDIARVDFKVLNTSSMAINQVDANFVPTPGAAGLLGLAGIAATRRRRC